jgi:diaminopimelate epimerase
MDATGAAASARAVPYLKADGTGNDFVVVLDLEGALDIPAAAVRQWCDRDHGVGADGLLRIVRIADGSFFMDYRNADGSLAETCGNGLRVVAHVLRTHELIESGEHALVTRGGIATVSVPATEDITVGMGLAKVLPEELTVMTADGRALSARAVLMPNPHAVAFVDDVDALGDLAISPTHEPIQVLPDGANYEFIQQMGADHIRMRVFERGVGETKSCGSGACAAAVIAADALKLQAPWTVRVDVPGGTLTVTQDSTGEVSLTGPAQVTASGTVMLPDASNPGSLA